jgi:hypothetical protein
VGNNEPIPGYADTVFHHQHLNRAAFGNGRWIVVGGSYGFGYDGLKDVIGYSDDAGFTWTEIIAPAHPFGGTKIKGVAFGNGRWVAVGTVGKIAYSNDNGLTWTLTPSGTTDPIFEVAYANGLWLAGSARGKMLSSTDGITWVDNITPFTQAHVTAITYDNGIWIAASSNYVSDRENSASEPADLTNDGHITDANIAWSDDGIHWTVSYTSREKRERIYSVAYGDGVWIGGAQNKKIEEFDGNGRLTRLEYVTLMRYSTDNGKTWKVSAEEDKVSHSIDQIAYSPADGWIAGNASEHAAGKLYSLNVTWPEEDAE